MLDQVTVFAPATIANIGCGYDVLGLALQGLGDRLLLQKRKDNQLIIQSITGDEAIPYDWQKNVATVAIKSLLLSVGSEQGFDLFLTKNIPAGSGLGSSASSSAAAVFAANLLLGEPYAIKELIPFAMEGERLASGKPHADNVSPSLMGGVTIIRSYNPFDVFRIPFPLDLFITVIYPHIEVKTSDARKILKPQVSLDNAVKQWGNVAGLVAGFTLADVSLIGRSVEDVIIEPIRSILIPFFDEIKHIALDLGGLGFSISGSGPSMFAFSGSEAVANRIKQAALVFYSSKGIESSAWVSTINPSGTIKITT